MNSPARRPLTPSTPEPALIAVPRSDVTAGIRVVPSEVPTRFKARPLSPEGETVNQGIKLLSPEVVSSHSSVVSLSSVLGDSAQLLAETFMWDLVRDPARGGISPTVVHHAAALLREARKRLDGLPVPTISPGPGGFIGLTWEAKGHHVSIEIYPDGHVENFWEDLATGELGSEEVTGRFPTLGVIAELRKTI